MPLDDRADVCSSLFDLVEEKQEFVAADACEHVAVAQPLRHPPGDLHQQRVADGMAVVIVDVLEIVEIDKGKREALAVVAAPERALDMLLNENAVGNARQLVEMHALRQVHLDPLALGDVEGGGDQKRLIEDLQRLVRGQPGLLSRLGRNDFLRHVQVSRPHQADLPFPSAGSIFEREKIARRHADQGIAGVAKFAAAILFTTMNLPSASCTESAIGR